MKTSGIVRVIARRVISKICYMLPCLIVCRHCFEQRQDQVHDFVHCSFCLQTVRLEKSSCRNDRRLAPAPRHKTGSTKAKGRLPPKVFSAIQQERCIEVASGCQPSRLSLWPLHPPVADRPRTDRSARC